MAELDLPEGLSPEARARLADDRNFDSLEDEAESIHDGTLRGSDGQHGWDIYIGWERVVNAEMLMEWLSRVGQSLDEFKKEEAFRANVDNPDFEWLRDL